MVGGRGRHENPRSLGHGGPLLPVEQTVASLSQGAGPTPEPLMKTMAMRFALRSFLLAAPAFLMAAPGLAQAVDVIRQSFGVHATPEGIRAGGPEYAARFDGRGMEFVPALGKKATQLHPVRFTLDSVRRGSATVFERTTEDVAPILREHSVRYVHDADLTEVYDVRREGVEQSFVFARRPEGHGDLVVRGLVTTDMALVAASDDGIRYEAEGIGGVSFGAVTGVDANGATARGSIRVQGDHVEWVLPAAFVDGAAYPMVLDPLVGTAFAVSAVGGYDDVTPAIAFDDTSGRYLVVWLAQFAGTGNSVEIRGQFLTSNGALSGSTMLIAGIGTFLSCRPSVANVNGTNRFLVSYRTSGPLVFSLIVVKAVDPATGVSNPLTVATGTDLTAVLGGDSRSSSTAQTVVVAYESHTSSPPPGIWARIVHVPATGDPVLSGSASMLTTLTSPVDHIAITAQGGNSQRWLVTWAETSGSTSSVRGAIVGSTGAPCSPATTLYSSTSSTLTLPVSASPDGTNFLVAWQRTVGSTLDVQMRLATWSGGCGSGALSFGTVNTLPGTHNHAAPALAFAQDRYLLAWRDTINSFSLPRVFATCISPETGTVCGTEWILNTASAAENTPAIASRYTAGDTTSNRAMVVWSDDDVRGHQLEAHGTGAVVSMGGGCGTTGFNDIATWTGDPVIGNSEFAFRLSFPSAPILALVLGLSNVSAPCGGCTIVPALDILLGGTTPNPLPLPCDLTLIGVDVYAQWVLLKPGGCPILPDFAFSNALRFTIGE